MSATDEDASSNSVKAGSATLPPLDSADHMDESAPALQPPHGTETTVNSGGGKRVRVTIVEPEAGKSSGGASIQKAKGGSLLQYMRPKMDKKRRDSADLLFVIWCCINLRPEHLRFDLGFKLFVGSLAPEYMDKIMATSTFDEILSTLHDRVKSSVMDDLRSLREECLAMGYSGAFLAAQLDLTTAAGEEYITFTVSYVRKGSTEVTRVGLATRAFPGTHTADDISFWIETLTREYFSGLLGELVTPSDVFLAFTVDQGGNLVNACEAFGVDVIKCNCHRVNSAVLWSLGIAGSASTCRNKDMGDLMKKLATCVGVFSYSTVNSGKDLQNLEENLHSVYELIRRNDTGWTSQFAMMDRLLDLKTLVSNYFRKHPQDTRKLTHHEWNVTNEVCSLLGDVSEATIRMQGAKDTHVGQAMFIMTELISMLKENTCPIRLPDATVLPTPTDGIPTELIDVKALSVEAQDVREVLLDVLDEKGVGKASLKVERLCALLDPRRKALGCEQLLNGCAALRTRAEKDLEGIKAKFVDARTPSVPAPTPVLEAEPAEPILKERVLSRLEERREARVRKAADAGGGGSGTGQCQPAVTGRHVLIAGEILVYLAEQEQLDTDNFNLLGFWNRRAMDSICQTTGKVTAQAEMPYLAFIARLYHAIEATSCHAKRNFSAVANLIGDLRSRMLAEKVEQMMLIRLNRRFIKEVRELEDAVEGAKSRAAKCTEIPG